MLSACVRPEKAAPLAAAQGTPPDFDLMVVTFKGKLHQGRFRFTEKSGHQDPHDAPYLLRDVHAREGYFEGTRIPKCQFQGLMHDHDRDIVFFIHGYNTQSSGAMWAAKQLQWRLNLEMKNRGQKPVLVIPIHWPSGDRIGLLRNYWADQSATKAAGAVLHSLFSDRCACAKLVAKKRLHVVAFSMGNRLLRCVGSQLAPAHKWPKSIVNKPGVSLQQAAPAQLKGLENYFSTIFLVAADVPSSILEAPKIPGECNKAIESGMATLSVMTNSMVVLYAGDDMALRMSGSLLLNRLQRLGRVGPRNVWGKVNQALSPESSVKGVDCSGWNRDADRWFGHSYAHHEKSVGVYADHMGF